MKAKAILCVSGASVALWLVGWACIADMKASARLEGARMRWLIDNECKRTGYAGSGAHSVWTCKDGQSYTWWHIPV